MPYRRLPNTISAVLRTLTTARDAWKQFSDARLIKPEHWAKLDDGDPASLLHRLLKEAGDVPLALAAQAPLTDAANKALARLTLYVSHFHQVYDFGVARGVFTAGGRAYYGREVGAASLPDLSSTAAVLEAAGKIAPGETRRAQAGGAGHVPMALPSAAQVAAILAEVEPLHRQSEAAKAHTDRQQEELGALYPEAQKLAVSICNTVEFNLSEREALESGGRRRIARLWGVVYIYEPQETPDPDDPNAANTTLPAGPASPANPAASAHP